MENGKIVLPHGANKWAELQRKAQLWLPTCSAIHGSGLSIVSPIHLK